jgi:hypothetical protein
MRRHVLLAAAAAVLAAPLFAQSPAPSPRTGLGPPPAAPKYVAGYVATLEVKALAPALAASPGATPEAQAMLGALKAPRPVVTRVSLAQDLSRQEIVSEDFVLPAGTVVLHRAGDKAYVIADPKTQTYAVMDAEPLLDALEGGAGIEDAQFTAKVVHTEEKRVIAGQSCRKSILTVNYVSAVPVETSRVLVQQKNDVEVWHTSALSSAAAVEHFFFKFQRDKTGLVRRTVAQEIGFPMEVKMVVTAAGAGGRPATPQPGSLHALVREVKVEEELDTELFRIPPAGYARVARMPWFGAVRPRTGGTR